MKISPVLKASVLALGLSLGSTAVFAQDTTDNQSPGVNAPRGDNAQRGAQGPRGEMRKDRKDKRMYAKNFGMIVPGFGPVSQEVVDSLDLSDKQKEKIAKLKDKAQKKMKGRLNADERPYQAMFEMRKQQLEAGKLDPKAMVEQRDKLRESMQELRDEYTEEWLELWDDLNNDQQAKIATYFKEFDATRGQRMKDGRGSGRGDGGQRLKDGSGRADAPGKGLKDGSGQGGGPRNQ